MRLCRLRIMLPGAAAMCIALAAHSPALAAPRDQVRCLALALYWEARTEGEAGMRAVGSVVLNRVAHPDFPDSVCAVIEQGGEHPPCQFSWWCDGRSNRPTEAGAWARALALARQMLTKPPEDRTGGALFFHNATIRSPWSGQRQRTVRIGRHIFYR